MKEAEAARSELRGLDALLGQLATGRRTSLVGGASGTVNRARAPMAMPGRLDVKDPRRFLAPKLQACPEVIAETDDSERQDVAVPDACALRKSC